MSERDKLGIADVARLAAVPGRSETQAKSRLNRWKDLGIIPPDGEIPARGGKAYVYPQTTGAIFAVLCDLFDAGIVVDHERLRGMWGYLAEPHAEGCHPHITHVLDAVAKGEACWLILTLWRDPQTGDFKKTCCTRFEDQADKPIAPPTPDYEPLGEYIVSFHKLLDRFTSAESNVRPIRVEG